MSKIRTAVFCLIIGFCFVLPLHAVVYYVNGENTNPTNGLSWGGAKTTIQDAIDAAYADQTSATDQVWVRAVTNHYNEHITLKEGVSIYGGFAGNETSLNDAQPLSNVTVIDGTNIINSVVTANTGVTNATVINGFTIQNGVGRRVDSVPPLPPLWYGGGIDCNGGSPTISNNHIKNNTANAGSGICSTYSTSPIIVNNTFESNTNSVVSISNAICNNNNIVNNPGGYGIGVGRYAVVQIWGNTLTGNGGGDQWRKQFL